MTDPGIRPRPVSTVRAALLLLARNWRTAYPVAIGATLLNTVPDVGRQLLVWDDPRVAAAVLVDVVGFVTAVVAQLWVTGALAGLPEGAPARVAGALRRGTGLARSAVRRAPGTVAAGVVLGGAVSALLTVPASVAAIGATHVLGPVDAPAPGHFAVAAVSDVVASAVTLPVLALVLVLAAGDRLTSRDTGQ